MIRKVFSILLTLVLIIGMASTASAAISSVTLDKTNITVTQGEEATFTVTVKNDNKSSARNTTLSIVDNVGNIPDVAFNFEPAVLNLSKNQTAQTVLRISTINTINTINTQLLPGMYTFRVRAAAESIAGRGQSGQTASSSESAIITLTVVETPPPPPEDTVYASTVDTNFDIVVPYGTTQQGAIDLLVKTVGIVGTKAEDGIATIDWIIADYNGTTAGIYTATGTLQLPDGWSGTPDPVTAAVTVEEAPPPPPETIHYLALGDSLVTGTTGVSGTMSSYVHSVFSNLQTIHGVGNVTRTILGYDGYTSKDLLDKLSEVAIRSEIEKADIITLSIGGNNVMPAARSSSFWSIDTNLANEGTANFASEYKAILDLIYVLNPEVTVISSTLYNPYNSANQPAGYTGDTTLHNAAEIYIDGIINKAIREYEHANYYVAEVHTYFLTNYGNIGKMGDVTFFYPRYNFWTWFFVRLTRDPHLNQKGQDEMGIIHNIIINNLSTN